MIRDAGVGHRCQAADTWLLIAIASISPASYWFATVRRIAYIRAKGLPGWAPTIRLTARA